jgi:hypothetical protein
MRKIRFLLFAFCITLVILCCSCGFFGDRKYTCEADSVESIQIVELGKVVEGEYYREYTVLAEVTDTASFVEKLNCLQHSVNWGDPVPVEEGYIVIRIDYQNGEYDYIHADAQIFHRSGVSHSGFFFFDDEQFNDLIAEYWPE